MKNKGIIFLLALVFVMGIMTGCKETIAEKEDGNVGTTTATTEQTEENRVSLEDGTYLVDFNTDSSMFRVNDTMDGKGKLTVQDGVMTLHVSLPSKNIVNLYVGLAQDAQKSGAVLLNPVIDTVTYSDGMTEEVNGYDIPVPYLEEEFDLAIIGTKGKWYDHKVSVTNPEKEE